VQQGAPGVPGTVRLLNQSANTPLVAGGGAAKAPVVAVVIRSADTTRFLAILCDTKISGLVAGGMISLFIASSLNAG
jgi:hypothetical protein